MSLIVASEGCLPMVERGGWFDCCWDILEEYGWLTERRSLEIVPGANVWDKSGNVMNCHHLMILCE